MKKPSEQLVKDAEQLLTFLRYWTSDEKKSAKTIVQMIFPDKNERYVRTLIAILCRRGEPICSNNDGYWIAESGEEVLHTVRLFRAYARSYEERARLLANHFPQSQNLFMETETA